MIGIKYTCLAFAIAYTFSNIANALRKDGRVTMAQLMIMGISISGFLFCCETM